MLSGRRDGECYQVRPKKRERGTFLFFFTRREKEERKKEKRVATYLAGNRRDSAGTTRLFWVGKALSFSARCADRRELKPSPFAQHLTELVVTATFRTWTKDFEIPFPCLAYPTHTLKFITHRVTSLYFTALTAPPRSDLMGYWVTSRTRVSKRKRLHTLHSPADIAGRCKTRRLKTSKSFLYIQYGSGLSNVLLTLQSASVI